MKVYFAPLEGMTDEVFRRAHHDCFGGVDKYFIPFVSPTQNLVLTNKEQRAVSPAENAGVPVVPQILAKDAGHFLWVAQELADLGHTEVNLNMGCPSGTVTAKGKGAGMLRDLDSLAAFLDEIFARSPLPVSLKTRIGFETPDEWPVILSLLSRYPVHELIIHPRTRSQFYKGEVWMDAYAQAVSLPYPVVYNGDLFTVEDCKKLSTAYPRTSGLMLGRGLLANPALAQALAGGDAITRTSLCSFHDRVFRAYQDRYQENVVLGRMRELMNHMACCFEDPHKPLKAIRKAKTASAYLDAANLLFDLPLCDDPHYLHL